MVEDLASLRQQLLPGKRKNNVSISSRLLPGKKRRKKGQRQFTSACHVLPRGGKGDPPRRSLPERGRRREGGADTVYRADLE